MKIVERSFFGALLAGVSIGIGGLVYLSVDNKYLGAFLFAVGLFTVCVMKLDLFTGRVCYVFEKDGKYALTLPVIWIGNFLGTGIVAMAARATRGGAALAERAAVLCKTKTDDTLLSLFLLGFLCNILIYIAVDGFAKCPHEAGKYLSLVFGVMVFILAGTEHCIADMFYFWCGGAWDGRAILSILVITLGNSAGGVFFPLIKKLINNKDNKEETK